MAKKDIRTALKVFIGTILAIIIIVVCYLGYVLLSYSRIEDNLPLIPTSVNTDEKIETGKTYTAFIQNLGFGAYTRNFTFFMDGGTESWAESEESVIECINKGIETAKAYSPDFIMFQEVDFDSTRSYHVDQQKMLSDAFSSYSNTFAVNYDSAFLMYPFTQPHGASKAGIMTLSRYNITSAVRRSLPISESVSKFLDLDRCYSVSRIPVKNGKELVIYNVHLSAYGGSDEIRTAQMTMLSEDMKKEYEKGNYCICGGDFNHDFTGDSTQKLNNGTEMDFGWAQPFPTHLFPDCIIRCDNYTQDKLIPTCRNCDIPYKEGNPTFIVDGFLVTDNIEVTRLENIQTDFEYSDHNPVIIEFILK